MIEHLLGSLQHLSAPAGYSVVMHVGCQGGIFGVEVPVDALVTTLICAFEGVNVLPINLLDFGDWVIECIDDQIPSLTHVFWTGAIMNLHNYEAGSEYHILSFSFGSSSSLSPSWASSDNNELPSCPEEMLSSSRTSLTMACRHCPFTVGIVGCFLITLTPSVSRLPLAENVAVQVADLDCFSAAPSFTTSDVYTKFKFYVLLACAKNVPAFFFTFFDRRKHIVVAVSACFLCVLEAMLFREIVFGEDSSDEYEEQSLC